jgi:fibronectin-binding autotransporter adhesin
MKTQIQQLSLLALLGAAISITPRVGAAGTTVWSGGDVAVNTNWSDTLNWSPGSGASNPPGTGDTVIFGAQGSSSVTLVDNTVDANTAISSLLFTNVGGGHDTLILTNVTLTVNGLLSVGLAGQATPDAMSGPGNFTVNNVAGPLNIGGSGGATETATLTLADGTNTINVSKLSIGESAGSNGRQCTLNLGNGINIINADTINLGTGKAQGTIQFAAAATSGSVKIRNTAGTGRASLVLGNDSSSGSATCNGKLLLAGHFADVLASTTHIPGPESAAGTGGSIGSLTADNGVFDTTSLNIAENSPGTNTHPTCVGTLTIGGNPTNTITLIVNSPSGPGGGQFFLSDAPGGWFDDNGVPKTTLTGNGTFNLNTNGIAQIYCSMLKVAATSNTATLSINGGTLNMEAATNTIGTRTAPIDNVTLDFATLNVGEDGSSLNLAAINLTLNDTNVINVASLPPITHLPTTIPVMSYTTLNGALNLGVGTLPGDYQGHIADDGAGTISLVITSGTVVVAKQDIWVGSVNNNWDVSTLNWTNASLSVTNYTEADFVTFNDTAVTGNVTLLGNQHAPSGVTVNNSTLNYVLSGSGRISGATKLTKSGSGSVTLAETGGDNFAGGIVVHGGTLILDDPSSAISGGLTNDAGTAVQLGNNDARGVLPIGGLDDEGTLVFKRSDNVLLSTIISGGGGLSQGGSGSLILNSVQTYSGNTTVSNGVLALNSAGSVASPLVAVKNATLDVSGSDGSGTHFNALTLTNGTLNASNVLITAASLSASNSTIILQADANVAVGGQAIITATSLITGGTANTVKLSSLQNLVLSPTLPIVVPLISYGSATFAGGFNFALVPPVGLSGYISNDVANSSIDLVITNAPQSITWNGGSATDSNWSDAANWSGSAIAPLDALTFDGVNRLNNTNDTAAGTTYTNITFNTGPFILNGNSITLRGTMLNSSSSTQAVNLGFTANGNFTLDGGTGGGALAINGGVTNNTASPQTVTLLNVGSLKDSWATNAGASGGGQLQFSLGASGGDWTILDASGTSNLVSAGNVQLTLGAGSAGGAIEFGTSNSAPNVDLGAGFVSINSPATGNSNAFNMNSGKLKATGMSLPASGAGYLNMNGGTLILGSNSLAGGNGAGGGLVIANINGGSIFSTNGGVFQLTARCPATFNLNAGLVQCGTFQISAGTASSGNGTNFLNGGILICTNITCGLVAGNASSTVYFNGGTLKANAASANFISQNNLAPMTLIVSTNGVIFDTTNFNDAINLALTHDANLDLSQPTQDGGLTKLGTGTLTLGGANSYNGSNTVNAGTLFVSGSVLGNVKVNTGTLAGTGSVGGAAVINGVIAPGTTNNNGVLTVVSNVTINASGTASMKLKKGSLTNDVLSVTDAAGTITYGGILSLTNISGTLAANDTFKLFNAANYAGSFANIVPATPGSGLTWNTNNLTVNGTLSITGAAGPTTNANILSVKLSGNNLLIHGTNNNGGQNFHYAVLSSTNIATPLSNWTSVVTNPFNADGTFDYSTPVDPTQPKVFIDVKAVP